MERFRLSIKMENAAFEDQPMTEVCRILRGVVERIEGGEIDGTLRDANGNRVGFYVSGKD